MAKVLTFAVNDAADPEAVIVQTVCQVVEIGEDPSVAGWPTTAFKVYIPTSTDGPRQRSAGATYAFVKRAGLFFYPGEIAGYVATVTGATTFFQDES
jgi:hypothetical protein